ncbi:type VI secretion system baseplate subunit TssK [Sorangium sp. So ce1000]|uniref:type VI secretion system baseplate subunit TssK n=1 Tax=Sorangium sp. So ce1000 TaxID=3133325 RepID=UPI003F63ACC8
MSRAFDVPAAVQWHEGMLLAPQHFQRLALRSEELIHYHARSMDPFHYGVHRIRYDVTLLAQGIFRVIELEAILPDGLVVVHRSEDEILEINLEARAEDAKRAAVQIYLAVSADKRSGTWKEGDLARYTSVSGQTAADENTGDEIPIAELRPRAHLIATSPPPRYCALPLLAVKHDGGAFVIDDYIPPMLEVTPESPLGRACARVALRVREKALYLAESMQEAAKLSQSSTVERSERLLPHLVAALPGLEALLRTGTAHPFSIYLALCSLAGHVAAVGNTPVPPVFSAYDHLNLARSFGEVIRFIFRCIDEGISEAFRMFPMDLVGETFRIQFQSGWFNRELILGVLGQPGTSEQDVRSWIMSCRIASEGRLKALQEMRVLGAARAPIERREKLVPKRGMRLFTLTGDPSLITANEWLVIENAADWITAPRPAQIFLYVQVLGGSEETWLDPGTMIGRLR